MKTVFQRLLGRKPHQKNGKVPPPPPDLWTWLAADRSLATLIDIGANDGSFGAFIARHLRCRQTFAFEPQSHCLPALEACALTQPAMKIFNLALSDRDGQAEFFENSNHPSSSLLRVSDISKQEFPHTSGETPTRVAVARLDDVLARENLDREVFIKIDVQGVEDKVILGGQEVFRRAKYVMIEQSFVPIYEDQPLFEEVHDLLRGLGFRFAGVKNQIDSPRTGQPLFAHCLYQRAER